MWKFYAILSAVFAALTAIFAKIGIKNVNSDLATAIRTVVILLITWGIVFFGQKAAGIKDLTRLNWTFLVLSGVATGLSWLFYFKALQFGEVSKVASIDKLSVVFVLLLSIFILREPLNLKVIIGALLICTGGIVMIWK